MIKQYRAKQIIEVVKRVQKYEEEPGTNMYYHTTGYLCRFKSTTSPEGIIPYELFSTMYERIK